MRRKSTVERSSATAPFWTCSPRASTTVATWLAGPTTVTTSPWRTTVSGVATSLVPDRMQRPKETPDGSRPSGMRSCVTRTAHATMSSSGSGPGPVRSAADAASSATSTPAG